MSVKQPIVIKGAKTHNLKNIDVSIPRNQLVVVTGVSGSGKSSLVFDTLYAEGHRRYVESLSSYARQFVARMQKPPVEYITGISPAIAIEQRVHSSNPRSTVGSITEIYDYLRLLYARIGKTFSPKSGEEVKCQSVTDVVDFILQTPEGAKVFLLAPFIKYNRPLEKELEVTIQKGFSRLWVNHQTTDIQDLLDDPKALKKLDWEGIYLLVDRFINQDLDENFEHRIADSVQTAFNEGNGRCFISVNEEPLIPFSEAFEKDGIKFEKPTEQLFNFNNPIGACTVCEGTGRINGYDEDLIIPNKTFSVAESAVYLWRHSGLANFKKNFIKNAPRYNFDPNKPYYALSKEDLKLLWFGNDEIHGIWATIRDLEKEINARNGLESNRIILAKYKGTTNCHDCGGSRLRREALYVKINDYTIADFLQMSIDELKQVFTNLQFNETEHKIAERIIQEIGNRLTYLAEVGLGYLNLSRKASTLSGGETQRINLATSLGSNLTGSLYILDEPSIGLHPRDTERLITILETLRNLGNTVIVVEHDESVMRRANHLIDVGPFAGLNGGEIVFSGDYQALIKDIDSLTGKYLSGREEIPLPDKLNEPTQYIVIHEAAENNLKGITVGFPVGAFTAVTGVSGSGKTTLIKSVLYPALRRELGYSNDKPGLHKSIDIPKGKITGIEMVDQTSVSTSMRSTPVSYVGAYEHIRNLFAGVPEAYASHFTAGYFTYNMPGGRCEACEGDGVIHISMQFMPDIELICETCNGKRFREAILEIKYKGKNISDVLNMSVEEAFAFFSDQKKITDRLKALVDVGLGYVRLGQSTSTLSGGEAQRLKLAYFLHETDRKQMLYIFDEPTTGLHAHDVKKLIDIFRQLVAKNHTVIVIEHNLDVIKCADYVVDLGPEGGVKGGELIFSGRPSELAQHEGSYTGQFLKEKFE